MLKVRMSTEMVTIKKDSYVSPLRRSVLGGPSFYIGVIDKKHKIEQEFKRKMMRRLQRNGIEKVFGSGGSTASPRSKISNSAFSVKDIRRRTSILIKRNSTPSQASESSLNNESRLKLTVEDCAVVIEDPDEYKKPDLKEVDENKSKLCKSVMSTRKEKAESKYLAIQSFWNERIQKNNTARNKRQGISLLESTSTKSNWSKMSPHFSSRTKKLDLN